MQNKYNNDIESTREINSLQQNPYINQNINTPINNLNTDVTQNKTSFNNGDFLKGALIGATVTFLLTNKNAQNTIFNAIGKGTELFQVGMEELKERYEDIKAQRESSNQEF